MATPFIKWVGGKTQLLPELTRMIPDTGGTYFEPFIGGGAAFFSFADQGRFKRAVINDFNPELTNLYRVVRDRTGELIDALNECLLDSDWNTLGYFRAMRASEPEDEIARAARLIYLNKTAFNGLFRVNAAGKFNAPFGRYTKPRLYEADNLWACRRALASVEIRTGDFAAALHDAKPGDVVYLDPPYIPLSRSSSFTKYSGDFGPEAQERLAKLCRELVQGGVYCVVSNSDTSTARVLYSDFEISTVEARRSVNSDATKRGKINELLIIGKPPGWLQAAPDYGTASSLL
jgi:DNA adenine methylase